MLHRRLLWWRLLLLSVCLLGVVHGAASGVIVLKHKAPGGGGAFSFVQSNTAVNDGSSATIAVTLTGVTAGNLVVIWYKWEGAPTAVSSGTDGTSSLSIGTVANHSNTDLHGAFAYLLVANSGTRTYTITVNGFSLYERTVVFEYSYTGTASLAGQNIGSGSGTACASGTVTTTGTNHVGLGGYGEYSAGALSSATIGGVARDRIVSASSNTASLWDRVSASAFTTATAAVTIGSGGGAWICNMIAFKTS